MDKRIEDVCHKLCTDFRDEFGKAYLGAFLVGSHASGNPHADSDVDLDIMIEGDCVLHRNYKFDEIDLDVSVTPVAFMATRLRFDPFVVERLANGCIIEDSRETLAMLQQLARRAYPLPRPKIDRFQATVYYFRLRSLERSLGRARSDSDIVLVQSLCTNTCIEVLTALFGVWKVKPEEALGMIRRHDACVHSLLERCLDHSDDRRKAEAFSEILNYLKSELLGSVVETSTMERVRP